MKVLIVDDYADAAKSLALVLETYGFECRICFDGLTAMQVLEEFAPGVVVLDSRLPDTSGAELAASTRGLAPGVPIIGMLSQLSEIDSVYDECFVKPPEVGPFVAMLHAICQSQAEASR